MKIEARLDLSEQLHSALDDLATAIRQHYPDARSRVSHGVDDPTIVQLVATVKLDDTDAVHDIVMEGVLQLQAEGLPVFVVTERPLERTLALYDAACAAPPAPVVRPS